MQRATLTLALLAAGAAPARAGGLDDADLPLGLALPFLGVLLSIALGPLLIAHVWHRH